MNDMLMGISYLIHINGSLTQRDAIDGYLDGFGTVWARYGVFVVPHSRFGRSEAIKSIPMRLCHLKEVGNRWYINGDHGIPTRCRVGNQWRAENKSN